MEIKQNSDHTQQSTVHVSKMKNKPLPNCLQGSFRDSLGEFSSTSQQVWG